MAYMSAAGGFFHKFARDGRGGVSGSQYYSDENIAAAEELLRYCAETGKTITQALLEYCLKQEFPCVPLYGPRSADQIKEAMEIFA